MKEEELYKLKAFLDRSKNRKEILKLLDEEDGALRPTDMAKKLGIQRTNISTRVTDLLEEDLVKLLNPEDNRNRYYKITEKGKELLRL